MPRPKSAERSSRIDIRCAEHERERWHAAAALEGLHLSDWIRRCLDRRAEDAEQRPRKRTIPIVYQHADKSQTIVGARGGVRRR